MFKNDETAWCSGFAMARSWLNAGTKLNNPAYGCVVVFWRSTTKSACGHVGFIVGRDKRGNLMVLGYRWCGTQEMPATHHFALPVLTSDGWVSVNEA